MPGLLSQAKVALLNKSRLPTQEAAQRRDERLKGSVVRCSSIAQL